MDPGERKTGARPGAPRASVGRGVAGEGAVERRRAEPRERTPLQALAAELGVHTEFIDGLGREVVVCAETLVAACAALGAGFERPGDAPGALEELRARPRPRVPEVTVAWDGVMPELPVPGAGPLEVRVQLETGGAVRAALPEGPVRLPEALPPGYHRLEVEGRGWCESGVVISAPVRAWRDEDRGPGWGLGTHLAALRSRRSRSVGDLRDLRDACRWVAGHGGDVVTVLPLLPTFNSEPAEPSPYSPVSRLFWSELLLDLGDAHRPAPPPERLDVGRADAEVRAALRGGRPAAEATLDGELVRYACFRGAQARLGRNWRAWPASARDGTLSPEHVDPDEERFHLVAQALACEQLGGLRRELDRDGVRLGFDLAVGVHPDGYDPWSRPGLFAGGMSVGAPPDPGFPSGQDWGFPPVLPEASRAEGHRYLAASVAHQAALAGVLRVDHVMAMARLYWIPHGAPRDRGTYVSYPEEELFAILSLESHRNRCEIVGEDLGTVPEAIERALPRHGIRGMFLAEFEAGAERPRPPAPDRVAMIGTHDTPTFAGWLQGVDIDERVRAGLLAAAAAPAEHEARTEAVARLAEVLDCPPGDPPALLAALLDWLGGSPSPLVVPWIEDLWLEPVQVNLPGTTSAARSNWQRPMARTLDEAKADERVGALLRRLARARAAAGPSA